MTSALRNSVVLMARSVLPSVSESGVQRLDTLAEMVSKHDECRFLNRSKASILSTHWVQHRSLSFLTADPACVQSMASSSFFCLLDLAEKIETLFTTPIIFRILISLRYLTSLSCERSTVEIVDSHWRSELKYHSNCQTYYQPRHNMLDHAICSHGNVVSQGVERTGQYIPTVMVLSFVL